MGRLWMYIHVFTILPLSDKVLTVENLRGKEEIRIANEKRKEENKSVFKLFKKTVKK